MADVVKEQSQTVMIEANQEAQRLLEKTFGEMEKQARATLRREGFPDSKQKHERSVAARYKGQSFELQIKQTAGNIAAAFHRAHQSRYGYAQAQNVVEIVSARVRSSGIVDSIKISTGKAAKSTAVEKPHEFAETYFERRKARVAVYQREELAGGSRLRTPCIVTEYSATTLIPEKTTVELDRRGNVIIQLT